MSWPTQEQFDAAHKAGTEYALQERANGATEPREAPLSGEWADDPTPWRIAVDVGFQGEDDENGWDAVSELADAWERGYFDVWAHS